MGILHRLYRDTRASTLMELAFTLPILVMMVFGGTELSFYMMSHQKVNQVAMSSADLISQGRNVSEDDIKNVFAALDDISGIQDFNQNGLLILTSVLKSGTEPPKVQWQRKSNNTYEANSAIGSAVGDPATLPADMPMKAGDGLIIAEVFYTFRPMMYESVVGETKIKHKAFYRPRFGALTKIITN